MKNNITKIFVFILLIVALFVNYAVVDCSATAYNMIKQTKQEIIDYNVNATESVSFENWIHEGLPDDIGNTAEWYVLALSQQGHSDFYSYEQSLLNYLSSKKISSESSKLKFALVLSAIGSDSEYIQKTLNGSMGKQGIMSFIYGLHLINNGYTHSEYTVESAIDTLLNMQNSDGGWSLKGDISDVDVTAMTLQTLAPYYQDVDIKKYVDKALVFLSEKQIESGEYISYGSSNPEGAAQVIVALSSLGIDFLNDNRFIKNGNSLFDGICKYRLEDGSFSHTLEGITNKNTTVQVYYSLVAYERFKENKSGLYILDSNNKNSPDSSYSDIENSSLVTVESSDNSELTELSESLFDSNDVTDNVNNNINLKIIFSISIIIAGVLIVILLAVLKKLNKKNLFAIIIIFTILLLICLSLDIKTKDQYYNSDSYISKDNNIGTVTMSITCHEILKKGYDNSFVPKDGTILEETSFFISEDDTVYSILIESAKKNSIHIENDGTEDMAYISGINYIYEFDYGDFSGWMFYVNGVESSVGCSSYKLSPGDIIEWRYTVERGIK